MVGVMIVNINRKIQYETSCGRQSLDHANIDQQLSVRRTAQLDSAISVASVSLRVVSLSTSWRVVEAGITPPTSRLQGYSMFTGHELKRLLWNQITVVDFVTCDGKCACSFSRHSFQPRARLRCLLKTQLMLRNPWQTKAFYLLH